MSGPWVVGLLFVSGSGAVQSLTLRFLHEYMRREANVRRDWGKEKGLRHEL